MVAVPSDCVGSGGGALVVDMSARVTVRVLLGVLVVSRPGRLLSVALAVALGNNTDAVVFGDVVFGNVALGNVAFGKIGSMMGLFVYTSM